MTRLFTLSLIFGVTVGVLLIILIIIIIVNVQTPDKNHQYNYTITSPLETANDIYVASKGQPIFITIDHSLQLNPEDILDLVIQLKQLGTPFLTTRFTPEMSHLIGTWSNNPKRCLLSHMSLFKTVYISEQDVQTIFGTSSESLASVKIN